MRLVLVQLELFCISEASFSFSFASQKEVLVLGGHFRFNFSFDCGYRILSKISDSKKWECPEIFRESLIIEPKCPVCSREVYSAGFIMVFL